MRPLSSSLGSLLLCAAVVSAQPAPTEFDVVSIKRSPADATGNSLQTLPDGTFVMHNGTIRSIILAASPAPTREAEGYPAWVATERYDITAKPPAGATREQRAVMMRRMFEDRMQLKAHIEQRQRDIFLLVVARADGRLGPQLTPSTLDCRGPRAPGAVAAPPQEPPEARCGGLFGNGRIVSGGTQIEALVPFFSGLAGRQVINRTGLDGFYALTLRWAPQRRADDPPPADDAPDFVTAIQEQLGLKLQPAQATLPVMVVDAIERPSEN